MASSSSNSSASGDIYMRQLEEDLPIDVLEKLACKHAQSRSAQVQLPPMRGSYNLIYVIKFPDGRKWVARIPDPSFTDSRKIESMVGTMQLISERTSIPLPIVHAYDSTPSNDLGYAYVLISFVEGVPLSDLWTKPDALTDANRRHIFQHVANSMAQLRVLEFDRIGVLEFTGPDRSYTIGPLRKIKEGQVVQEIGPFPTALSYVNEVASSLAEKSKGSPSEHAHYSVLRLLSLFLPDRRFDGPPFVLSPPDFDSQNVMVDPVTFDVTGFLDWDGVYVGSREAGYARYPAWITRDWDPVIYDWPPQLPLEEDANDDECKADQPVPDGGEHAQSDSSREEPPEVLQAHRDLYHAIYSDIDPTGAEFNHHSHILEAVIIALTQPELSAEILSKLIGHVFENKWVGMGDLLLGIEGGDWAAGMRRCGGVHSGDLPVDDV